MAGATFLVRLYRLPATTLLPRARRSVVLSVLLNPISLGRLLSLLCPPNVLDYVKTAVTGPAEAPLFPRHPQQRWAMALRVVLNLHPLLGSISMSATTVRELKVAEITLSTMLLLQPP